MKKIFTFLILTSMANSLVYPAFADEYMVLPPIIEENQAQPTNTNAVYEQPTQDYSNTQYQYQTTYPVSNYQETPKPLQGQITTIPVGTAFQVVTDETILSGKNQVGETFKATLNQPIAINGEIVVPAGSEITGQITYVQDSGRAGKNAKIEIKFTSIKPLYGPKIPIMGKVLTEDNTGVIKGGSLKDQLSKAVKTEAIATAGGTIVGTGIGAALGGVSAGTGATVGAISGAGVGLAYALWRKGREVKIESGTKMIVVLEQPFNIGR